MWESDLFLEIEKLNDELLNLVEDMEAKGIALAHAELEYNVTKTNRGLIEKAEGIPVSFIGEFIRGYEDVAQKRLERDIAESKYKASAEKINVIKKRLSSYEEQAKREYSLRDTYYPVDFTGVE